MSSDLKRGDRVRFCGRDLNAPGAWHRGTFDGYAPPDSIFVVACDNGRRLCIARPNVERLAEGDES